MKATGSLKRGRRSFLARKRRSWSSSNLELFEDHTAQVERTHLTMRQMNGRLIRTYRSKGPRLLEGASDA